MAYLFSNISKQRLLSCHQDIQNTLRLYMEWGITDCSIIEGYRNKAAQNRYCALSKSKVKFPNSKHNNKPSNAVDIAPYINGAISWNRLHCIYLAGGIVAAGKCLGISIRWGGNWDNDSEIITDQSFQDLLHYELIE